MPSILKRNTGKYYKKDKSGKTFIKTFQVFKLFNNIGKLIAPMLLTEEIMHTQLYDKVDEYNTSDYTKNSYKQETFEETINDIYKLFFGFEKITSGENTCLISVGFIMMTSIRSVLVLIIVLLICWMLCLLINMRFH